MTKGFDAVAEANRRAREELKASLEADKGYSFFDKPAPGRKAYEAYGKEILGWLQSGTPLNGLDPEEMLCPWDDLKPRVQGAWAKAAAASRAEPKIDP